MSDQPEVRIKLVADNQAAAALASLKANMGSLSGALSSVKAGFSGGYLEMAKGTLVGGAVMKAFEGAYEMAKQVYETAKEIGEEAIKAADAEQRQIKAMTGMLGLLDRGQHAMSQIRYYAEGVHDDLEMAGFAAGVAADSMDDAFRAVMERGTMSSEKARELTEQMAMVGKVIPGGMQALANGFSMVELGMVKARNPIVQLIASTGVLKGNAHAVAAAMQKMTPEKQIEAANKAIEKQAEVMKKGGAGGAGNVGLGVIQTTFGAAKEMFFEALGKPMLEHILPPLNDARRFLLTHIDEIKRIGLKIGMGMSAGIDWAASKFGEIYRWTAANWGSIERYAHIAANMIEISFGHAKVVGEVAFHMAEGAASVILKAWEGAAELIRKAADYVLDVLEAVPGVSAKVREYRVEHKEGAALHAAATGDPTVRGSKAFADTATAYADARKRAGLKENAGEIERYRAEREEVMRRKMQLDNAAAKGDAGTFAQVYNQAKQNHNEAFVEYAAGVIAQSEKMAMALSGGKMKIEGGIDDVINMIDSRFPDLADVFRKNADKVKKDGGINAGAPMNVFTGDIHIKQDFRDQDPGRILRVFHQDLAKQAENRIRSGLGQMFGAL